MSKLLDNKTATEKAKEIVAQGKGLEKAQVDFVKLRFWDDEAQEWKFGNVLVRDVLIAGKTFADLQNDTNVSGQNGQEVINNLNQKDLELQQGKVNASSNTTVNWAPNGIINEVRNETFPALKASTIGDVVGSNGYGEIDIKIGTNENGSLEPIIRAGDGNGNRVDYTPVGSDAIADKKYVDTKLGGNPGENSLPFETMIIVEKIFRPGSDKRRTYKAYSSEGIYLFYSYTADYEIGDIVPIINKNKEVQQFGIEFKGGIWSLNDNKNEDTMLRTTYSSELSSVVYEGAFISKQAIATKKDVEGTRHSMKGVELGWLKD